MGKWLNADGLYVKLGTDEGTRTAGGMFAHPSVGSNSVIEIDIDLTALSATDGGTIPADNVIIPAGAFIEAVELIVLSAAASSGSTGVLNIGACKHRTTLSGTAITGAPPTDEIDYDGFFDAITTAELTAGAVYRITVNQESPAITGTYTSNKLVGVSIGASPALICADYDTAAFTAGRVLFRCHYRPNLAVTAYGNSTAEPLNSNTSGFEPT